MKRAPWYARYAKAVVAGLVAGAGTLAIALGADPTLAGIIVVILGPLGVALKSNA